MDGITEMTIPDPIQIPAYVPSFAPVPQITPFTYRDGTTMLNKLDAFSNYLNKVIVPFINDGNAALSAAVEEDINNMLTLVNEAVAAIINSSVEVQDVVVAGIFEDPASATRVFTDTLYASKTVVDGINTIINTGRLSTTALDAAYAAKSAFDTLSTTVADLSATVELKADKTYVDAADTTNSTAISGVSTRVTTLETLTTTGRLSSAALDAAYVNELGPIHAVAIGSSNAVTDTNWLNDLATDNGWAAMHNYAVGGGGFTASGSGQFYAQISAAIADTSYDHNLVRFVFIVDMGNDIRATFNVQSAVGPVVNAAQVAYPNARIILIPAMWGNADDNIIPARLQSVSQRLREASEAGLPYKRFEIINWSWLWNWDSGNWMLPGEVHMNSAGYARAKQFVQRYLNGMSTDNPLGWKFITPNASNIAVGTAYLRAQREGDRIFVYGPIDITHDLAVDTDLGTFDFGYQPHETVYVPVTRNDRTVYTVAVYPSSTGALLRTFQAMPSDRYHFNFSMAAF